MVLVGLGVAIPFRHRGERARSWGGWERDVAGVLAFLRERPEVDRERLGGLGLSTGADVLTELAPERRNLRVVVADGATGRSIGDYVVREGRRQRRPLLVVDVHGARVLSGASPGPSLGDLVARISPTPLLLVSTGRGLERELDRLYAKAAREPAKLWDLPDVGHTAAIRERPVEYERRVVGLFERALLD